MFDTCDVYTSDQTSIGKATGVYMAEEWSATRRAHEPYFSDPTPAGWRKSSYLHMEKIENALAIVERTSFADRHSLGDIGGVPFYQARVLLDKLPNLQSAILTDYDAEGVELAKKTGMFPEASMMPFDAKTGDFSIFDSCDLLTMWGVDYALTDAELARLFQYLSGTKALLVLASIRTSWADIAKRKIKSQLYQLAGEARMKRRHHGWLRSASYLENLAKHNGCVAINRIDVGHNTVLFIQKK